MDITPYAIPAILALIAKGVIYFYARFSETRNLQTALYLLFLFALSIQNLAEITFFTAQAVQLASPPGGIVYFGASILALALLLHLALALAFNWQYRQKSFLSTAAIYAPALILEILLWGTSLIVSDFRPFNYTYTKVPGPFYFLFEIYTLGYLIATVLILFYGNRTQSTPTKRAKNKLMLLGMLPGFAVVATVISLQRTSEAAFNTTVILPVAITFFLAITAYATHQYRLFDIQFYIPWSKVRKRKTAFYDRIRAMIAELADLGSVNQTIEKLADTLRCPVALVGGPKPAFAAAGAQQMAAMPVEELRRMDHILVANEIADSMPQVHNLMKEHGVAAIVPFYPHSQNASSWLLLGDSFSEHVYTPLDFRMVEQLFDRMAELFLDKLLTMRTQLADAHRQIHTLEFRLQSMEGNLATLNGRVETLGQENLRLTREQPADSLLTGRREENVSITMLGRDKTMLKLLRERFPQVEHFAGPDSSSFRRLALPDVLICDIDVNAVTSHRKLLDLLTGNARKCAILLYGSRSEAFVFEHRKNLLGSLVELLPPKVSDDAITRKVEALVELRKSLYTLSYPDFPLIGHSPAFRDAMVEAQRIARFVDPVFIKVADAGEAVAVGAYMHECSGNRGAFRVLHAHNFLKREVDATSDDATEKELDALVMEAQNGTLMIDSICALSNETWERLITKTHEFSDLRLIGSCPPSLDQSPEQLFKPLRPIVLDLPTLRERRLDLPLLVHYYTLQFNLQAGTGRYLSQADIDELMASDYPADLATLKGQVFDRLRAKEQRMTKGPELPSILQDKTLDEYVAEFEARVIEQALKRCGGNKSKAARALGMRPNTLHYKLERYGLLGSKKND